MPPKTILRPPPLLKANPPDPAMFLQSSRMRKSDSSSIHSSTSTLKEELETLSHVRDRLTLANARSNDSITNSISSFSSMSDSNLSEKFDLMSVKGRILNEGLPRKSYRNDASLEAKECERALSYMDRYKRVKSGKSRHALHNEWNSSTKLTDIKSKREASKPKTDLRRSSVPTDSITELAEDASNESINTITAQSIDASVASGLGDNSTRALDESIPETRPNSAKPISNDDDFKKLSYSSIKEAPSLTSLSTVKPEIASVPPVHLSAVCKGCAIPIRSHEASLSAMGFLWHPNCFKCANSQCEKPIGQSNFFQRGKYSYCEDCWVGNCLPKCDECGMPVEDRKTQTLVQGHVYHKACFACSHCRNPLLPMSQYVEPKGVRYCLPCYQTLHGKKCKACNDICHVDFVSLSDGVSYHRVCITCTVCFRSLEECNEFYRRGDEFYCSEHHFGSKHKRDAIQK